jgi:hypothetical protein
MIRRSVSSRRRRTAMRRAEHVSVLKMYHTRGGATRLYERVSPVCDAKMFASNMCHVPCSSPWKITTMSTRVMIAFADDLNFSICLRSVVPICRIARLARRSRIESLLPAEAESSSATSEGSYATLSPLSDSF